MGSHKENKDYYKDLHLLFATHYIRRTKKIESPTQEEIDYYLPIIEDFFESYEKTNISKKAPSNEEIDAYVRNWLLRKKIETMLSKTNEKQKGV
jgi:hypothetical protein